jgi:hypothetical protein
MKKLLLSLLILCLFACSKPILNSDSAIKSLSNTFIVKGPEKDNTGTIFYEILAANINGNDTIYSEPVQAANKIKGAFDQNLGLLPQNTEGNKFSHLEKATFYRYDWESLSELVRLETYIKRNDKKVNANGDVEVYIKSKIWITKK